MARPTILSLFAGIGGLDLACRLVWPDAHVVGYVEWDAYAASILLARMEDAALECAPVYCGDVRQLDGGELRGHVDIITAGFPCTDISLAGQRAGIEGDASGLWGEVVRLAREIEPGMLFLENVSAIRSARGRAVGDTSADLVRALGTVLGDLAALGFDAEWLCLRASDVGAPHGRDRWFCLAHRRGERPERSQRYGIVDGWRLGVNGKGLAHAAEHGRQARPHGRRSDGDVEGAGEQRLGVGDRGEALADAERGRRDGRAPDAGRGAERRDAATRAGEALAHPDLGRREGERSGGLLDGERAALRDDAHGCRPFPPGPSDLDAWRAILADAPWLAPAVESGLRRMADGISLVVDASRADRLRCLGNAVVPLQAAAALVELLRRIR